MTHAVRAIAAGAWREWVNQRWRFSRGKVGLWPLLVQAAIAALLLWRLQPAPAADEPLVPLATAAALAFFGALVAGLIAGREALFGRSVLRALHVSPAPGGAVLRGLILAAVPQQLITGLLVGIVTAWLIPAGALWWSLPLLWGAAALCCCAGYTCALLALVGWVRLHPRSLAVMWGIAMMIGVSIAIVLIFLIMAAPPVAATLAVFRAGGRWLAGGILAAVGLAALPGLLVPLRTGGRPGDWYRDAYLNMQELGDGRRRLRASRWPRVLPGAAGALQARLWRELWLNWFSWVRLALLLLAFGFFFYVRDSLVRAAETMPPAAIILLLGLTMALGAFGELPPTMGSSDGPNIGLALVAGARAGQVVLAKWLACLPLAVLSALITWASAVLVGQPDLPLSLAAGFIVLGFNAIALAGGLADLDPHAEVTERDVPEVLRAALEQVPRRPGNLAGYFSALLFAVLTGWLCVRQPGAALPVAAGCAALAHLALVPAFRRLVRMGM